MNSKEKLTTISLNEFKVFKSELIIGDLNTPIPIISIVIPTYRNPSALKRAILSILSQEKFDNFEIIVVDNDDCSDKNENQMIIEQFNNHKILYYKNKKNIGMTGNWNRCFELSRSEWVFMLHTDDELLPNCLYEVNKIIKGNPNIISLFVNRTQTRIIKKTWKRQLYSSLFSIPHIHKSTALDFLWGCVLCAPTGFLMKRTEFLNMGGYKDIPIKSPNSEYTTSADDCGFYIKLLHNYDVWQTEKYLVIKHEEKNNFSHKKNVTIPLTEYQYSLFLDLSRKISSSYFTRCIFYYRIYNIQKHFGLNDTEINFELPAYAKNKLFIAIMNVIKKLYIYIYYLKR